MDVSIIVGIEHNLSATDKGRLLEDLTTKILKAQQYTAIKTIRITGMELDVLAKHNYSGQEIIAECKAWDENLPGDVITKLLGNVTFNNISAGWLVTTGGLGKDAEGLKKSWEEKPIDERKRLIFYTRDRIINLLVDNRIVVNPETLLLSLPKSFYCADCCALFITNIGMYWIFPGSFSAGGLTTAIIPFEAATGSGRISAEVLGRLKSIKSSYSNHNWICNDATESCSSSIAPRDVFESIATIVSGDAWTDYRPSRPEDYVGRHETIRSILAFFNDVQERNTELRLFAIKSPSGWGKSSTIIKVMEQLRSPRKKNHTFMYGVDVRTAMSERYAELAFKSCLEAAIDNDFIKMDKNTVTIGDIDMKKKKRIQQH